MNAVPLEILKQHIAIVGKTGSGKTSTEKVIVEQVVDAGFRVCVLDSTKSDWWGITSSASGKSPGLPFKIMGGPHGHVPLHSSAGKIIGQLVGSGKLPLSIIDMADFEAGGLQRFFIDFSTSLMRHAKGVLYLVIEEAHEFAPKERAGIGAENMAVYWAKKLATAGRSKGIRLIVATQRTQALHNAVLGSCETIIAHRLSAPADQEPVTKWLKANTDKETTEKVMSSLSSLPTGTGWLCSGEAKTFEMVKFPKFRTYDNNATPTGDSSEITVKTAPVDQDELRALIGDAVKEAEANDPAVLRKLMKDLQAQIAKGGTVTAEQVDQARKESYLLGFEEGSLGEKAEIAERLKTMANALVSQEVAKKPPKHPMALHVAAQRAPAPADKPEPVPASKAAPAPEASPEALYGTETAINGRQQKIIDSLVFWKSVGVKEPSKEQVAGIAGYKPGTGNFRAIMGTLTSSQVISYPRPGFVTLAGSQKQTPMSREAAKEKLLGSIEPRHRALLEAFKGAEEISREELAERTNYQANTGNFRALVGALCTIDVLRKPTAGALCLSEWAQEVLS